LKSRGSSWNLLPLVEPSIQLGVSFVDTRQETILSRDSLQVRASYEPPAGELEAKIAALFAEVFTVDRVGANDDFFDLGGDSILGESLATGISQYIGRDFRVSSLVNHGTPRKIAGLIQQAGNVPVTENERPPIFMVHGLRGIMLPRPDFLAGLAPGQRLRMFELPGIRSAGKMYDWVPDIAAEYVRQLNEEYPSGPVLLGAYCGGCVIAIEMVRQLAEQGRQVPRMVFFDPGGVPHNVLDAFLRKKFGGDPTKVRRRERYEPSRVWSRRLARALRTLIFLQRITDGTRDEDFTDNRYRKFHERKYLRVIANSRGKGAVTPYQSLNLSDEAQAKLRAAVHHYMPQPYQGETFVFCSDEFRWRFEDETSIWLHLLPHRHVQVLGGSHDDVMAATGATGAQLMQAGFAGDVAAVMKLAAAADENGVRDRSQSPDRAVRTPRGLEN
jgi:thioesterase domain-containing protein